MKLLTIVVIMVMDVNDATVKILGNRERWSGLSAMTMWFNVGNQDLI